MDEDKSYCINLKDGEDKERNSDPTTHADDRNGESYVTDDVPSDQPHSSGDQHETGEARGTPKSFCQQLEDQRSDEMESVPLRIASAHLESISQFSNSSILSGSENRNTHRKTGADMRILATYMRSLNELRPPEAIPPSDLDKYLSSFFLVVRKSDGSEYEPCSLRAMLASIERYLRQKNYPASLTRDNEFANMRNVLKLKQQMLRSLGKGQKTVAEISQSACVREGKITRLFDSHEMGPYNPNSIIFSLCFFFCMYLKLRKSTEHKKLLWGDIIVCSDYNNREYLTFSPQMLSRIHGSARLNHRLSNARVWAEPDVPERDPIALYKFYAQKRPPSMNQPYSPFYLGLNLVNPLSGQSWYRPAAMGINKLNEMVRQIRDLTGLKSNNDTSPMQYIIPGSQDITGTSSELSNAGSDPSNSQDGHSGLEVECKDGTPVASPQLTIDLDESCQEPIDATTSREQIQEAIIHDSDSSDDELSMLSTSFRGQEDRHLQKLPYTTASSISSFHHQMALARENVSKLNDVQDSSEMSAGDEEDGEDFISVEQAKELLVDILQRMDLMDIYPFDRWLKSMRISRDPSSGHIVCKDSKEDGDNERCSSSLGRDGGRAGTHDFVSNSEGVGMNILLNISLTPHAIRGQGPITVQATTVSSADMDLLSSHKSSQSSRLIGANSSGAQVNSGSGSSRGASYSTPSQRNSNTFGCDSPLDLAMNSNKKIPRSSSELSKQAARTNTASSSSFGHLPSLSLTASSRDCSTPKQRRLSSDATHNHTSNSSCGAGSMVGGSSQNLQMLGKPKTSVGTPVRSENGGSRRKPNQSFVTHIRPRGVGNEFNRSQLDLLLGRIATNAASINCLPVSSASSNDNDSCETSSFPLVLNLKQEVE